MQNIQIAVILRVSPNISHIEIGLKEELILKKVVLPLFSYSEGAWWLTLQNSFFKEKGNTAHSSVPFTSIVYARLSPATTLGEQSWRLFSISMLPSV